MEPRRDERKASTPTSGERPKSTERMAPVVTLERPFRIEWLEERIAPAYFLKIDGIGGD
jgi:hypothetical protein